MHDEGQILDVLGRVMVAFRDEAIRTMGLGLFCDVPLHAVPGVAPGSVSFFIDAHLGEATTRAQTSLGVSLRIYHDASGWSAESDVGWQVADSPGQAPSVPWDGLESDQISDRAWSAFAARVPAFVDATLARYRQAVDEYVSVAKHL